MKYLSSIFSALIFLNVFVWYWVIVGASPEALNIYFLDVGQGDSSLAILPGGAKLLVDGGPDKSVLRELGKVLPPTDRYIDLVMLSHPQLDHFAGLTSVLERYRVGAFLWNGRAGEVSAWQTLENVLNEKGIPVVILGAGDKVTYEKSVVEVLSPDGDSVKDAELNNTTLVALLDSGGVKSLFTGDIGFDVENKLASEYNLDVDILKVPHHGSKYSSGSVFLEETTPLLSVIQVGKNRYGHPTKEALARLAQVGSSIYRNDDEGTVRLEALNGVLNVFKKK